MKLTVQSVGWVDDLTLLPADLDDLRHILRALERWCHLTGMSIHPSKCGWQRWAACGRRGL